MIRIGLDHDAEPEAEHWVKVEGDYWIRPEGPLSSFKYRENLPVVLESHGYAADYCQKVGK
jgi:hypothetical protein